MSVLPRIARPTLAMDMANDDREPDQSDINAAARGLNMLGKSPSELAEIMKQHEGKPVFASKAIYAEAKQIRAVKVRNGATDAKPSLKELEDEKAELQKKLERAIKNRDAEEIKELRSDISQYDLQIEHAKSSS